MVARVPRIPKLCYSGFPILGPMACSLLPGANPTTSACDLGNNHMGSTSNAGTGTNGWLDGKKSWIAAKAPGKVRVAGSRPCTPAPTRTSPR